MPALGQISCNSKSGQMTGANWKVLNFPLQVGPNTISCRYRRFFPDLTDEITIFWIGPNIPPIADFNISPSSGVAPLHVNFNGSLSTDSDGTITKYSWDFGNSHGSSQVNSTQLFKLPGTYAIRLTVWDNEGEFKTLKKNLIVLPNSKPEASFTATESNGRVTFDASTSVDDERE